MKTSFKLPALGSAVDTTLDEAESAAGLAMRSGLGFPPHANRRVSVSWRPLGLEVQCTGPGVWRTYRCIEAAFIPHWLVVSTPGFQLLSLMVDNRFLLLQHLDADLFLWSNWDQLKSVDMLERVRIFNTRPAWNCGTHVQLEVQPRQQMFTFKGTPRNFRAMILGEELTTMTGRV